MEIFFLFVLFGLRNWSGVSGEEFGMDDVWVDVSMVVDDIFDNK